MNDNYRAFECFADCVGPKVIIKTWLLTFMLMKPDGSDKAEVEKPKIIVGSPGALSAFERAINHGPLARASATVLPAQCHTSLTGACDAQSTTFCASSRFTDNFPRQYGITGDVPFYLVPAVVNRFNADGNADGREYTSRFEVIPFAECAIETPKPEPPVDLTEEQKVYWRQIMAGAPAGWITEATAPLLAQLVRHLSRARKVEQELQAMQDEDLV